MRLRAAVEEYRVPAAAPLGNARARWTERRGLVLTLEDARGLFGQGEAAPLPGYSEDDLEGCKRALHTLDVETLAPLRDGTLADFRASAELAQLPPSARFAVETALLDLQARQVKQPMFQVLRRLLGIDATPRTLPLVTLLGDDPSRWGLEARAAASTGFAGVKAKIGRPGRLAAELDALRNVRDELGARSLRLDANRVAFSDLDKLVEFSPEFVEEPVAVGAAWPVASPVPLALDESLRRSDSWTRALAQPGVIAAMIKLASIGGFAMAARLIRELPARVAPVVSHTLEGPVGIAAAAEWALALGETRFAHGLAPHSALTAWGSALPVAFRGSALAEHAEPGLGLPRLDLAAMGVSA